MWALAWYDEISGECLLARDRFGETPLYIWEFNRGIYFASEIKGFMTLSDQRPTINMNQVRRYLVNGYKSLFKGDETFHGGVKKLPRATTLRIKPGGALEQRRYWKPTLKIDNRITFDSAVSSVKEKLIDAVEIRMRSDVPIGFCLSGGIDSNALVGIASSCVLGREVTGYTIMNTDSRYEESKWLI